MKRLFILFIVLVTAVGGAFGQKTSDGKVKTLVIDPGHGGDKPGALGKHSKEKDLVLSVALKFGQLVADNFEDVNIIYTHTTDKDISLAERAHIANRNKADLFISIHANSHSTPNPTGVETFVMGLSQSRANMEVAKKENADILLEEGYQDNEDYKGFDPNSPESYVMFAMYQNVYLDRSLDFAQYIQEQYKTNLKTINRGVKQAELFVLYKTTCPSVLTEIGFISNPTEEAFMMSDEGQAKIAVCLLNAFNNYKAQVEQTKPKTNLKINLPGYGKNKVKTESTTVAVADTVKMDNNMIASNDTTAMDSTNVSPVYQPKNTDEEQPKKSTETPRIVVDYDAPDPSKSIPTTGAEEEDPYAGEEGVVEGVTYKVQFLSSDKELPEGSKEFKGVTNYSYYKQGNMYRYTMGNEKTVAQAVTIQGFMRGKGFKDAFVVAFYNGKRITLQEAREMQNDR